ncbi:organic hydroperoxide resistance protein [Fictibacillus iocasae]|uniref:Organic hydroperoxide resistance protein n=1 Tax=Fictibacillus iocasae TaxID=2715437 RepID=A0ABW2NKI8_9BACL
MAEKLFTATVTAQGGREGHIHSEDGVLKHSIAMPGTPRMKEIPDAVTPEHLFAAGYAACFDGALNLMAKKAKVKSFQSETTAVVSFLKDQSDDGFKLAVDLEIKGKGVEQAELEELVEKAHHFCPYSKATRGNIDVTLNVTAE